MSSNQSTKPTVAVVFGGHSNEHDVSLHSAAAVLDAFDGDRHTALPVGITRTGDWYRYRGPVEAIADGSWERRTADLTPVAVSPNRSVHGLLELGAAGISVVPLACAFPVLHGRFGEDGTVQGMFELAGIPLVGCTTLASALAMDKERAHRVAAAAGIAVPRSVAVESWERAYAAQGLKAAGIGFPLFVKPARSGSSHGISLVQSPSELEEALDRAFAVDGTAILEERVEGFEVGCAVVGSGKRLLTGLVDEIELAGGFLDYAEKYERATAVIHMPTRVDGQTSTRITQTALKVYRALGCSGFARVDLFLTPDGTIVFNEVNTIPGLTAMSRFPAMMRGAGYELPELVSLLVANALEEAAHDL